MAYSESFIAEALAVLEANGGNLRRTAQQLGVSRYSLRTWSQDSISTDEERSKAVLEKLPQKKQSLADRLEEIAWNIACVIDDPDKLERASVANASTAFGIVVDKMRLLRGEATDIHDHRGTLTVEERARRVVELLDEARARRDRPAAQA